MPCSLSALAIVALLLPATPSMASGTRPFPTAARILSIAPSSSTTIKSPPMDDDLIAWQVCRQRTAIAVGCLCAPPSLRRFRRIFGGVAFGSTLLRILQDKLQLIEVELL